MMRDAPDKFERLPKLMSENEVRDDSSVQTAVRNLFIGSAPERESELAEMWKELDLIFQLTPDIHEGDRIIMDAGAYRYVRFNHRVLRAFWIAGYTAWEGSRTVAEAPSLQALDLTRFRELILSYESCLASTEADLEALPVGVAEPGQYPDANTDPQGRAASELATIAVAWALLHELRHIRHQREGTGADPYSDDEMAKHDEELSCDAFAATITSTVSLFGGFPCAGLRPSSRPKAMSRHVSDHAASSSSKALACFKSSVSKPSVNQP